MKRLGVLVLMVMVAFGLILALSTCESDEEPNRGGGDDDSSNDDDTGDDDTGDDDTYPGELALKVDDPTAQGLGKLAATAPNYQDDLNSGEFTLEWNWLFEDGDATNVSLFSTDGLSEVDIDFRKDTDLKIWAFDRDAGVPVTCTDALELNTWYSVKVEVNPTDKAFSVYLDGEATDCTDVSFSLHSAEPVLKGLWIAANNTITGTAQIDNILIKKGTDTLFSEDWQSYEPGDEPSSPWSMEQVIDVTFEIVEVE